MSCLAGCLSQLLPIALFILAVFLMLADHMVLGSLLMLVAIAAGVLVKIAGAAGTFYVNSIAQRGEPEAANGGRREMTNVVCSKCGNQVAQLVALSCRSCHHTFCSVCSNASHPMCPSCGAFRSVEYLVVRDDVSGPDRQI